VNNRFIGSERFVVKKIGTKAEQLQKREKGLWMEQFQWKNTPVSKVIKLPSKTTSEEKDWFTCRTRRKMVF
jgi:hypothetical protein